MCFVLNGGSGKTVLSFGILNYNLKHLFTTPLLYLMGKNHKICKNHVAMTTYSLVVSHHKSIDKINLDLNQILFIKECIDINPIL